MKIFCDESGGFDGDKHSLILSAVRMSDHDASRLMKQFRKATRSKNEVKGGLLTEDDRIVFFDMLGRVDHFAAVVTCKKSSALGATVSNVNREHEIFEDMLAEACMTLTDVGTSVRVSADGGRYSRQIYDRLSVNVGARLTREDFTATVDFVRSEITPGVQVADIVANTIYKATKIGVDLGSHPACGPLVRKKQITVSSARLETIRPSWMAAE